MKRLLIAKISEISIGVVFIGLGVLLYGFGFIDIVYGDNNVFILLLLFLMAVFSIESGIFWIKRFYLMQAGFEIAAPKRFIAKTAAQVVWFLFALTIIRIFFAIIGFAAAYYLLFKILLAGIIWFNFYWTLGFLAMIAVYLVLRKFYKEKFLAWAQKMVKKTVGGYPTVEIAGKDLILRLGHGYLEKYRDIKIPLSEIEDIKVLDRYEGLAFLKYVLGPDVEFVAKSIRDKVAYSQGKIRRPKFFAYMENANGAKTLYLQGPDLLYLVGVKDDEGLKDVVRRSDR